MRLYISFVVICWSGLTTIFAQTYNIATNNGQTIYTCSGTFYDSGGPSGNYTQNENNVVTFCATDPNDAISLNFTFFDIEPLSGCPYHYLTIFDGPNVSASVISVNCGNYTSGQAPHLVISSGNCLTFRFITDNFATTWAGWAANISCIPPCTSATGYSYRDEFASATYNNSNGLTNWATSWIEVGDGTNVPTGGRIRITSGELRMRGNSTPPSISRSMDLSGVSKAVLTFNIREVTSLGINDRFFVDVYNGSSWTTVLEIIDDFSSLTPAINLTPFANSDTRIRFRQTGYTGTSSFVYIDNVNICFDYSADFVTDYWLEAECGSVGRAWFIGADSAASNNAYIEPKIGENYTISAPADPIYYVSYEIDVDTAGDYRFFGRVWAPNSNDDSFWVRANGGTWIRWNDLGNNSAWLWRELWNSDAGNTPTTLSLTLGINVIDIAIREDGTRLDKIFITLTGSSPIGLGDDADNCYSLADIDSDGDGIPDYIDLDDDNDGIPDVIESPANISFEGTRTLLFGPGSTLSNLLVGAKVLYSNAIRDCNDIFYDIVITITARSTNSIAIASGTGINLGGTSSPANNRYLTFTIEVVELGSATPGNPAGTPASIPDFVLSQRDIDSNPGVDATEVVGFSNATAPDYVFLDPATVIQLGGFLSGGPGAGYTYYRMIPLSGPTNWTANVGYVEEDDEAAIFMFYSSFSIVEIVFGQTGSSTSSGDRWTRFGGSKDCDRDGDGVPNRIDLDLDNDGIYDMHEAGHGLVDLDGNGRIDGAETGSGANGLFDGIETFPESGILNYTLSDSDGDGIYDFFELDSDSDGCYDTQEADVWDPDVDGIAGSGTPGVDIYGLVNSIIYQTPATTAWQDSTQGCLEICGNGIDDDGDGLIDDEDPDCANYYLEAECGFPGANWNRGFDTLASNNDYLTIGGGLSSLAVAPENAPDLLRFSVAVTATGTYRIFGRVYSTSGANDSFWFRVNGGTWYAWNDWNTAGTWIWREFSDNNNGNIPVRFILPPGVHFIDIAYRENGARLDKLHLTINGNTPSGYGEDAINCGRTITPNLFLPYKKINKQN